MPCRFARLLALVSIRAPRSVTTTEPTRAVDSLVFEGERQDLDDPARTAALDHGGEHRGQAFRAQGRYRRPRLKVETPSDQPSEPTSPNRVGGFEDRSEEQARRVQPQASHAEELPDVARVARQRLAESGQSSPRVGHDHLEPTLGKVARPPLRRRSFEGLLDERMPIDAESAPRPIATRSSRRLSAVHPETS